jgi:cold shock protein
VAAVVQGEVIRFDQMKGYGFISPKSGGEDVFLHVNDLLDEKYLIRPGSIVEFVMENGERGPKASSVHVVTPAPTQPAAPASSSETVALRSVDPAEDDLVDVLAESDFRQEVTEVLLRVSPALTGAQILEVRTKMAEMARRYGWIGG